MKHDEERGLIQGLDGKFRCDWAGKTALYQQYHDEEWGRPESSEHRLYEKIVLEGFQAGLSWITILKKRENFREAFAHFDPQKVAEFGDAEIERLVKDKGIVRHRLKIKSAINNAKRTLEIQGEFGSLGAYLAQWRPKASERPSTMDKSSLMALTQCQSSVLLSKDLKKRGFSFVGPTTLYAFMQAQGMVNDHFEGCWVRGEVTKLQDQFPWPKSD